MPSSIRSLNICRSYSLCLEHPPFPSSSLLPSLPPSLGHVCLLCHVDSGRTVLSPHFLYSIDYISPFASVAMTPLTRVAFRESGWSLLFLHFSITTLPGPNSWVVMLTRHEKEDRKKEWGIFLLSLFASLFPHLSFGLRFFGSQRNLWGHGRGEEKKLLGEVKLMVESEGTRKPRFSYTLARIVTYRRNSCCWGRKRA